MATRPFQAAMCSGLTPLWFAAAAGAPAASNAATASRLPPSTAWESALLPLLLADPGGTPCCSNARTRSAQREGQEHTQGWSDGPGAARAGAAWNLQSLGCCMQMPQWGRHM